MRRGARRCRAWGLTLIEALVTLAIVAAVVALALPVLAEWTDTTRLRAAATVLLADLRLAQSAAQQHQTTVTMAFAADASGHWCYGWGQDGVPCDCLQPEQCHFDGAARVVSGLDWPGIRLVPGVSDNAFTFNPRRGTVTAGNVTLHSDSGHAIRIVVHGMGRIRLCQPAPAPPLSGLPPC